MHLLVNAIQMGTHNTRFYKENHKKQKKQNKNIAYASFCESFADLFPFKVYP